AIQPLAENKVRFTHVEELQGLIAPVFGALMGRSVQRHHDTFNESLKSRAEAMAGQQPQRARDGAERCLCIDAACRRCGRRIVPACRPSQDGMRGGPVTSISYSAAAGANGAGLGGSLGGAMVTSCAGSASPLMKPSQRVPH